MYAKGLPQRSIPVVILKLSSPVSKAFLTATRLKSFELDADEVVIGFPDTFSAWPTVARQTAMSAPIA
jgi:hypothetical protein